MYLQCFITPLLIFLCTAASGPDQADIVRVHVPDTVLHPGKSTTIGIEVNVKEGYHIQADKVNDKSLIPVTLEIISPKGISTGRPVFPSYKLFRLEGTEDNLNVFDGRFEIKVSVKAPAGAAAGKRILKAKLRYQACNARTCLFPRNIEFEIPVLVMANKQIAQTYLLAR